MSGATSPFDRCTERARKTLRLAAAIACRHDRSDIQGSDLLLALWNDACVAGAALKYGDCLRNELPVELPDVDGAMIEHSPFARQLTNQAMDEARELGHSYAGTEHQLLALMRLNPELVDDAKRVRDNVLMILGHAISP